MAFGLDNQSGPKYIASQSGTIIDKTTHVAYLITQRSKEENVVEVDGRRKSQPTTLTVIKVKDTSTTAQPSESQEPPTITVEEDTDRNEWTAIIPISASLIACALCAYSRDWYCFAMISLGIISNGLTCLVVGSALVTLKGVKPAIHAPPGDGMLMDDSSNHVVILKGAEGDVNWVTKGRFCLEYLPSVWMKKRSQETGSSAGTSTGVKSDPENDPEQQKPVETRSPAGTPTGANSENDSEENSPVETYVPKEYRTIGLCGLLLGIQSLLQLLIIPQGTLSGQIIFLSSFAISWGYNLYLASLDKEKIQQKLLFSLKRLKVEPTSKFKLCTRTTAAVFATLVLRPPSTSKSLKCFVPNETALWEEWRTVVGGLIEEVNWTEDTDEDKVLTLLARLRGYDTSLTGFNKENQLLLRDLLNDAEDAFKGYYHNYLKMQRRGMRPSSSYSQRYSSSVLDTERRHANGPGMSQDVEAVENLEMHSRGQACSYSGGSTGTLQDDSST